MTRNASASLVWEGWSNLLSATASERPEAVLLLKLRCRPAGRIHPRDGKAAKRGSLSSRERVAISRDSSRDASCPLPDARTKPERPGW